MGIFDGYLLCSDFDGTMALEAKVSRENLDAIAYFQREGGVFCPTSGRDLHFFHRYSDEFRANGPVIVLNGTTIAEYGETPEEDRVLWERRIPLGLAWEYVERMLAEQGVSHVRLYDGERMFAVPAPGKEIPAHIVPHMSPVGELREDLLKIITVHDRTRLDAIRAATEPDYRDRFVFGCSWPYGYEAQMIGSDKGSSALRVKEMVGAHTLVTVGDYENDLLMLKAGDVSYAVGDALDCLKEVADRITVPCAEHAIAAIVGDLERDVKAGAHKV